MAHALGSTWKQKRSQGCAAAAWAVSSYRLDIHGNRKSLWLVIMERLQ